MLYYNEDEIEDAVRMFGPIETPNLAIAAATLYRLMRWTNANSDGWCYWPKPCRAAKRLMEALNTARASSRRWGEVEDLTDAQLKAALIPVKSFLTRNGGATAGVVV